MISYIGEENFNIERKTVVTFGKFDGMHKGHQKLINKVVSIKEEKNIKSAIFTFAKPPVSFITGNEVKNIYTREETICFLKQFNIDYLVEYPFNDIVRKMEPKVFIRDIIAGMLNAKYVVVGTDFKFGYNRKGDFETLREYSKEYGYELIIVEKEKDNSIGREISSTYIKELLEAGKIKKANELLGHNFSICGDVIHGNEIGRTIGIPTLNVLPEKEKFLPLYGVYASKVKYAGKYYYGVTNIGKKPSIKGEHQAGAETHLFDFNDMIYGEKIEVELLEFIRPERKFESVELLKRQLEEDVLKCNTSILCCFSM